MKHAKKVLIADDDECLVDALAHRCQALGLVVERAYDGISALKRIDAVEPDLVILDVNMPSGSGLAVCEMLSHDPYLKQIPIIVLTGRTDAETMAACNRIDAVYVHKGPRVWSQLAPFVAERLGLAGASAEEESSEQPLAEEDCIRDQYIDTILTALGGNSSGTDESRDDGYPPDEAVRPWVLCVDDDPDFAATLTFRLAEHGVDVFHACAGMEGYRCAFTHEAKAIILDQEMPNGDGEYILRRLKDNPVTKAIPVIVLTGRKDQALARRMYNLGAAKFLTKPVDWNDLWDALRPLVPAQHQPEEFCGVRAD